MAGAVPADRMAAAIKAINAWRLAPDGPVDCPVCGKPGLEIIDRSARPYAEWYALNCPDCGLDHTIHIPLAPPPSSGVD